MSNELIVKENLPMNLSEVKEQVNLIQQIMKDVMKVDEHYGTIPGCNKPSLYKAGAEKLTLTFKLAPFYTITKEQMKNEHLEYNVICTLKTHAGNEIGQGVGSCTTMEGKYRFRGGKRKCPKCDAEAIIKGKAEYGGGWLCFAKKGGCGQKFGDNDTSITEQTVGQIEYENPADYYNTVLKVAKKRAYVDAMLTCTAASDIFTQDVEDMPEVMPKKTPLREKVDSYADKKENRLPQPEPIEDFPFDKKEHGNKVEVYIITESNRQKLSDQAKKYNVSAKAMTKMIKHYGFDSSKLITVDKYDEIYDQIEGMGELIKGDK